MRKNWLAAALACLLILAFGQANATMTVHAESPQAVEGAIPKDTDFSIDLWIEADVNVPGGGFSFKFEGSSGLTDVTHVNVGGDLTYPSVEYLNDFDVYFANLIFPAGNGFDGALPDSMNISFLTFSSDGIPAANPDQPYIRFNMNASQDGILCIDSCTNDADADWDWLFTSEVNPVTFNGPYCWTIGNPVTNNAPVISCPGDQTATEGSEVAFTVTATDADVDDVLTFSANGLPTGASLDPATGAFSWTPGCDDAGTYNIEFIVSDTKETDNCFLTITVNADDVAPVITCPSDITVDNDAGECGAVVNFEVTATDNCPGVTVSTDVLSGTLFPVGVTPVTATATDADGNTATCSFNVTVNDTEAPSISCPIDLTISCDASTDPAATGTATATDNCDLDVLVEYSDVTSGNTLTRTWVASDDAGNVSQCDQVITIIDNTPPVITCPADLTVSCEESVNPEGTGFATATDNCDIGVEITYDDVVTDGACPQEYTITRTWTATDSEGNASTCDQVITVTDEIAPVITCPGDVTVPFGGSTDPAETGTATATDNCSTNLTIDYTDVESGNVITRTWTASDECGNSVSCDQLITIEGSGAPVIICPDDVTVACDASTDPAETGTATATDDNDPDPTIAYTDETTAGDCPQSFVITRTWTATDADGNVASCTQTITVVDDVAPVITCPADVTLDCTASTEPAETGMATATDNCDAEVDVTYSDAASNGTIVRTWTATDDCGNASTCDQTITIDDATAPTVTCPADITVACVADTSMDNTGMPTFSDDCDADPVLTIDNVITEGSCVNDFTIARTFTVTDAAGNSNSCTQTITVFDDVAPVITCPDDVEIPYDGSTDPAETGMATATDNCGDATVTYADEQVDDVITRTWTVDDGCGNVVSCVQTITILPMPDPTIEANPMVLDLNVMEGMFLEGVAVDVFETLDRNILFTAMSLRDWLTFEGTFPMTTPATLTFDIDATMLTFGNYFDTISVISDAAVNSPIQIIVNLNVEPEVAPPDSVWVSTVPGVPGSHIVVPVYFRNNDELNKINLPLEWSSDALTLDSVSFVGTRVEDVDNKGYIHDDAMRQVEITVEPTFTDPVMGGRGLLAKLHFEVYNFIPDLPVFVEIDKTVIGMGGYLYFEDALGNEIIPVYTPGGAVINEETGETCGRVVDIYGNEIEGATVELWDDFPVGAMMTSVMTDINGQFACGTLGVVPFDAYAHKEGYYPGLVEDIDYGELGFDIVLEPIEEVSPTPEWVEFFSGETCVSYFQNIPVPVGSVIDAYTPDGIHCGTAYVTMAGEYIMNVYRDDPRTIEKDGAEPGEAISFYINGYPANATGDVTWTFNGDVKEVCLDLFTIKEVVLELEAGWNLVSWNVDTPMDDVEMLFGPVMDDVEVILGFEQGGFTYDPTLPGFSTLENCDHLHGYWVNMANARTLTLSGSPVAATTPIALEPGWNLVSYLPDMDMAPADALVSIESLLDVAMGWYMGNPETYDPVIPEYATLTTMRNGYGYWLNMNGAADLTYPGEGGPLFVFRSSPLMFDQAVARNNVTTSRFWMDAYGEQLTLDGQLISGGSEIVAVTEDGRVLGAGTVASDGKFGFMPIYGDDPQTETVEGAASGETIRFVVNGVETVETYTWNSEYGTIELSALTSKNGATDPNLPDQFGLHQNYPNPFNPTTTLSFSLPKSGHVTLEVYNVLGEKVATVYEGMAEAGLTSVVWDGKADSGEQVASGIYFARMKSDQYEQSRKMVLMK